ncbi:MAG: CoB--CoM heterodisulfide reductase iron-sulfur subunit A family protein [Proteobacteria bacterium]|nr:CoB--CoM heterodisulfide reductase iron-sulfur subunit A family protein [Pseudomonadota bacterium]
MSTKGTNNKVGSVMVVGAGVAGIQASLDMANAGYYVHLVDSTSSVGGLMAQLDKTFPTNDCAMCVISPFLVEVGRHLNINIIPNSELESLEGEAGAFLAKLKNNPRYIDSVKCTACGQCRQVCPVTAVNEFDCRLDLRKATFIKFPQAVPLSYTIDRNICIGCGMCEKACLAGAISYSDQPKFSEIEVGAVVLAMGNELFDPSLIDTYAYSRHPNVVTSLEFERILSASGPYKGHLMRPYDREIPQKIAWLQCIGSRDINHADHSYCSSVCCMYSIKQTIIAKEHADNPLDAAIFYMDMRTHGKEFERYRERAEQGSGVRFIRSRVHTVEPLDDGGLKLKYIPESGEVQEEVFDMVVLATGFSPSQDAKALAQRLGIDLNDHSYAKTSDLTPVCTSKDGIYVCGTFQSPKDIPQSVMEASAAAASATQDLSEKRWSLTLTKELPSEKDFSKEEPRIGVFVCNCGINIGGVADVPAIREYAKTLPNVIHTEDNLFTCSQDTQENIKKVILEKGINRVVVASCSPRTHEPLFQETIREIGLNPYLFEMANIRDQNTWVHMKTPERATEKAKDLVRMAVAKAALLESLPQVTLDVTQAVLVVGGGIAGLEAALGIARQGFDAFLVERSNQLGGMALGLNATWQGEQVLPYVKNLIEDVQNNKRIKIFLETKVGHVTGTIGSFTTTLKSEINPLDIKVINHGAAILATGGKEYRPEEYLYGKYPQILTHLDLDAAVRDNDEKLKNSKMAVFIQCVGSRTEERPYCSRVCCTHSIKSALILKKINPDMQIFIIYRDIRTYGFREDLYKEAREQGIRFIRYNKDNPPVLDSDNGQELKLTVKDHILQRPIEMNPDLVVLAAAILPNENKELFEHFKVPTNSDGFLVEAHAKLRPVDFASEGLFLAGIAHYPKSVDESIAQAKAAVSRAMKIVSKNTIAVDSVVASVNPDRCAACLTCVRTCPYNVPTVKEEGYAVIEPSDCHGCGCCVSECPGKAITLKHFTDDQINAKTDALFYIEASC